MANAELSLMMFKVPFTQSLGLLAFVKRGIQCKFGLQKFE